MSSQCYCLRMRCMGDIERLDSALASLAREETALRLRLGQVLEVTGRRAFLELGFTSMAAYAIERCERSVRWVEGARCLARRLEALPALRRALAVGKVSWSMAEVLARVATSADEARWMALAESRTVRQVRLLVAEARASEGERASGATGAEDDCSQHSGDDEEVCTLTCTVDHEEAWLFESTRCLLDHMGTRGTAEQSEAMLAEAQGTLLAMRRAAGLPHVDLNCLQECDVAHQRWLEHLQRWRDKAESLCEKNILGQRSTQDPGASPHSVAVAASSGMASLEKAAPTRLDQEVRALSEALARHELELSVLVLRFHRADGWRRLRYATETQYARERLGLSRSSFRARRALALRLETLPAIAAALGAAQIGVEAALQLVRIATPKTAAAWIDRARRRTIKHLREEVSAALIAVRLSGERDCPPPAESEMAAFNTLEQAVVSGQFGRAAAARCQRSLKEPASEQRSAWCLMLRSLAFWLDGGLQMSAARNGAATAGDHSSAGRVTLRLRMSRETFAWWRGLEAQALQWLPQGMSWIRFLCLCVWQSWQHMLGTDVAYGQIYIRDRYRCMSPVCNRRDVTPHHLQFRSAGGGDEDANLASVCTWCHLYGIHGGRIRARGTADHIHWELGARDAPCLVVDGRERKVA